MPDQGRAGECRAASVKERGLSSVCGRVRPIRGDGCGWFVMLRWVPHQGVVLGGGSVARHLSAPESGHGAVGPRPVRTQSVRRRRHRGGSHAVSESLGSCPSLMLPPVVGGSGSRRRGGRSRRGSGVGARLRCGPCWCRVVPRSGGSGRAAVGRRGSGRSFPARPRARAWSLVW